MEQLIELLKQIQELAGVGIDALGEATKGEKPDGPPREDGPPKPDGPPDGEKPGGAPDQGPPPERR